MIKQEAQLSQINCVTLSHLNIFSEFSYTTKLIMIVRVTLCFLRLWQTSRGAHREGRGGEIILTTCQIFHLKCTCTKFNFGWSSLAGFGEKFGRDWKRRYKGEGRGNGRAEGRKGERGGGWEDQR